MEKMLITMSDPQAAWLRDRAAELDIPISELVRRVLDQERERSADLCTPEERASARARLAAAQDEAFAAEARNVVPPLDAPKATTKVAQLRADGAPIPSKYFRSDNNKFHAAYQTAFKIRAHTQKMMTAASKEHGIDLADRSLPNLERMKAALSS